MYEMTKKTGVAIIFFNRPYAVEQVFKAVANVKPKNLYLIQDGARNEKDTENVKCCQEIVENVDWECNVFKNYSEVNLGCGMRMKTGISWVFEQIDRAIILEDDCVPQEDFFRFTEEMLEKYEKDKRILMISGLNLFENFNRENDYFFAMNGSIWGWATWRRSWQMYDYSASRINDHIVESAISYLEPKYVAKEDVRMWKETNRKVLNGEKLSYWAHQWRLVKFSQNNVCIIPKCNLINNVGDRDATHPLRLKCEYHNMEVGTLQFPLKHPDCVVIDYSYDENYCRSLRSTKWMRFKRKIFEALKCKKRK